jgi:predicted dehydrogenase
MSNLDRRDFLRITAAGLGGVALGSVLPPESEAAPGVRKTMIGCAAPKLDIVRIGYIGVGGMGSAHVNNLLKIKGAEIRAVCDIVESKVNRIQDKVVGAGFPRPEGYANGDHDYKRMCQRDDLDLVFLATPWEWHVPMCLEAMKTGKHAATEVPAALSVEQCWQLVETSEKTRKHCVMMENCNYDRIEMMILNMVKQGMFGELLHGEGGYLHDLRSVKHDLKGEGLWRRAHSMKRNGDLYPTHGLGPVCQCMDINRGNYFDYVVSVGSQIRGLHLYAEARFGPESPQAKEKFVLSDVVTTLIKTKRGETIVLTHDTSSPRPYSRNILVQGTKGLVRKYPEPKVYIEGRSKDDDWEAVDAYLKEFDHPIWKQLEDQSKGAGHGGMDFIEDFRLIDALLSGRTPDTDVYDGAVLSAITELSGKSIAKGGMPMKFPDFTGGKWKEARALEVMKV